MTGFLANLVGRSFNLVPVVQPRLASMFEPVVGESEPAAGETLESEGPKSGVRRGPRALDAVRAQTGPDTQVDQTTPAETGEEPVDDARAPTEPVHGQVSSAYEPEVNDLRAGKPASAHDTALQTGMGPPRLTHFTPDSQQEPNQVLAASPEPGVPVVLRPRVRRHLAEGLDPEERESRQITPGLSDVQTASPHVASPDVVVSQDLQSGRAPAESLSGSTEIVGYQNQEKADETAVDPVSIDMKQPPTRDTAESGGISSSALIHTPGHANAPGSTTDTAGLIQPPGARTLPANPQMPPSSVQRTPDPVPTIRVTIGRIEVHAETETPAPRRTARPSPRMSLDDYLRSQAGRRQ